MQNSGTILWKEETVGTVSNIVFDMWYIDADWTPAPSDACLNFTDTVLKQNGDDVIKDPEKGLVARLQYNDESSAPQYVLILSINNAKIFMRIISDEIAAYVDKKIVEPWQQANDPAFHETELKKEISFFHPLKWKKVKAVAFRTDTDDVLFEVLTGRYKYAVVHLTWQKESSRKFPSTHFYKDWQDVFVNRLSKDHQEWMNDQ